MIFPFSAIIPTLESLAQSVRAAFVAQLPGADAWIPINNVGPTAKVLSGALWQLYGRLAFVAKQAFCGTAVGTWLDLHGADLGMPRKPAAAASGLVDVTVSAAGLYPAGTQFQGANGVIYASASALAFGGAGTQSVEVTDITPEAAGNAIAGAVLTILTPFIPAPGDSAPFTATAVVDSATPITGGADVEQDGPEWTTDLSFYRGRLLFRKRNPPQGGAPSDYVLWATSVPGCTRVFVERLYAGPGTVRIFPFFDLDFPAYGGIPNEAQVALVANAIAQVAPAEAAFAVQAATATYIEVTVSNLNPNNATTQAAVTAELQALALRRGRVSGSDSGAGLMDFLATPASFPAAWIAEAVIDAAGVVSADVSPTTDTALAEANAPVINVGFS